MALMTRNPYEEMLQPADKSDVITELFELTEDASARRVVPPPQPQPQRRPPVNQPTPESVRQAHTRRTPQPTPPPKREVRESVRDIGPPTTPSDPIRSLFEMDENPIERVMKAQQRTMVRDIGNATRDAALGEVSSDEAKAKLFEKLSKDKRWNSADPKVWDQTYDKYYDHWLKQRPLFERAREDVKSGGASWYTYKGMSDEEKSRYLGFVDDHTIGGWGSNYQRFFDRIDRAVKGIPQAIASGAVRGGAAINLLDREGETYKKFTFEEDARERRHAKRPLLIDYGDSTTQKAWAGVANAATTAATFAPDIAASLGSGGALTALSGLSKLSKAYKGVRFAGRMGYWWMRGVGPLAKEAEDLGANPDHAFWGSVIANIPIAALEYTQTQWLLPKVARGVLKGAGKQAAKRTVGEVAAHMAKGGAAILGDYGEQVGQEFLQGLGEEAFIRAMQLVDPKMKVDWSERYASFKQEMITVLKAMPFLVLGSRGMSTAAQAASLGIERSHIINQFKELALSEVGAFSVALSDPDAAIALADNFEPSRQDVNELMGDEVRWSKAERIQLAGVMRTAVKSVEVYRQQQQSDAVIEARERQEKQQEAAQKSPEAKPKKPKPPKQEKSAGGYEVGDTVFNKFTGDAYTVTSIPEADYVTVIDAEGKPVALHQGNVDAKEPKVTLESTAKKETEAAEKVEAHKKELGYVEPDELRTKRLRAEQEETMKKDKEYQALKKKYSAARSAGSRILTEQMRVATQEKVAKEGVTRDTFDQVPIDSVPAVVRQPIQAAAQWLLDRPGTGKKAIPSLKKIIQGKGADVGAAVEQQKERLLKMVMGEQVRGLTPNEAPPPGDPIAEAFFGQRRVEDGLEGIESIDKDKPNALSQDMAQRLYDMDQQRPEGAEPSEYMPQTRMILEQMTGQKISPKLSPPAQEASAQGQIPAFFDQPETLKLRGEHQQGQQKAIDFAQDTTGAQPVGGIGGSQWLNAEGRLESETAKKDIDRTTDEEGQTYLHEANPYMAMPIDQVKAAALKGNEDAQIAMAERQRPEAAAPAIQGRLGEPPPLPPGQAPTVKPISAHAIMKGMEVNFGVPIRRGHMGTSQFAGFYKTLPQVVRMKSDVAGNLAIGTHEVAHHIQKTNPDVLKSLTTNMRAELKALDYDTTKRRTNEGYAEYMRHLMFDGDAAKVAPNFHKWFTQQWLPEHKTIQRHVAVTTMLINQFKSMTPLQRVDVSISKDRKPLYPAGVPIQKHIRMKMSKAIHRWYRDWKDEGDPINELTKELRRQGYTAKEGASPYDLYMAMNQWGPTASHHMITNGVFTVGKEIRQLSKGLPQIFDKIPQADYKAWRSWAYARHALEAHQKGVHPGISHADAQVVYDANKDNIEWEDAAQGLTDYNNALIDMLADAGVITAEESKTVKDFWKTYMPLYRVQDSGTGTATGKRMVDLAKPLMARRGADLPIIDPIEATIERTLRFADRAIKQQVMSSMVKAATATGGMGGWIEIVPPNMQRTTIPVAEVVDQLQKMGLPQEAINDLMADGGTMAPELMLNIYRPNYSAKGKDPIARLIIEGKPQMVQFDPDLYGAVSGMSYYQLPIFLDMIFGKGVRLTKLGATGLNFDFAARNPVNDYVAYIFQKEKAKGLASIIEPGVMLGTYVASKVSELTGVGKTNPYVELWEKWGGPLSETLGLDIKRVQRGAKDVLSKGTGQKVAKMARHPVDTLREVVSVSEVGPRLAEFKAVLRKHGFTKGKLRKGDMPPRAVLIEAINAAADVTVNFKRQGRYGKVANRVIPYFNVPLEATDKFVRVWKKNPKKAFVYSLALAAGTVAYWWNRKDDDDYREAEGWVKYSGYTITDDEGNPVRKIPRGHQWGVIISGGVEALLDTAYRRDPEAISDWMMEVLGEMTPGYRLAIATPIMEWALNYDLFQGRPITTRSDEGKRADKQVASYTTETAKAISRFLVSFPALRKAAGDSISPKRLEKLGEGLTGRLTTNVIQPVEALLRQEWPDLIDIPLAGAFELRRDYGRTGNDFYTEWEDVGKNYAAAKADGVVPQALEEQYRRYSDYAHMISAIRKLRPETGTYKEQQAINRYITGLQRTIMDKDELDRYPNPLTATDMPVEIEKIAQKYKMRKLYTATEADHTDPEVMRALAALEELGYTRDTATRAFRTAYRARHKSIKTIRSRYKNGKLTAYGQRILRLRRRLQ